MTDAEFGGPSLPFRPSFSPRNAYVIYDCDEPLELPTRIEFIIALHYMVLCGQAKKVCATKPVGHVAAATPVRERIQ
jgi:hypothetical protein